MVWRPSGFFSFPSPQKNDREKELVLLQRAHRQQQAALRRCQEQAARAKGLEETVRQQEKVSGGGLGGKDGRAQPLLALQSHPVPN